MLKAQLSVLWCGMSDRHFYGPDGEYRGRSTAASGGGALVLLGFGLWAIYAISRWTKDFLYGVHDQPYQFVADFYRILAEVTSSVGGWFIRLTPTPFGNLNGVILIGVAAAIVVGLYYAVREAARRLDVSPSRLLKLVGLALAAPALAGLSWWTLIAVIHWLFTKAG